MGETMPIHRIPKIGNFVQIQNEFLGDPRLSWEARGVGGYLLSKPDDWEPRMHDLLNHGPAGEAKMRRILKELEHYGYMRRERIRLVDGCFTWTTHIFERPGTPPPPSRRPRPPKTPGQSE